MQDASAVSGLLAPGVALTSAVIYWGNLQGRLGTVSVLVRALDGELRALDGTAARVPNLENQLRTLVRRTHVLHVSVVLSVVTMAAFIGANAVLFAVPSSIGGRDVAAADLFMLGLGTFVLSLVTNLWETWLARRSLDDDIAGSRPGLNR
jgi:hypothetical protein